VGETRHQVQDQEAEKPEAEQGQRVSHRALGV
jgi:hypothetical protein